MARTETLNTTSNYVPSYTKVAAWGDMEPGDPVAVAGEDGDFVFKYVHVKNGVVTDVICHGGVADGTVFRAFYPERVRKIRPEEIAAAEEAKREAKRVKDRARYLAKKKAEEAQAIKGAKATKKAKVQSQGKGTN